MSTEQERIEQLLQDAIRDAKAGNRSNAQALLREVTALDEQNEKGWIWLASVVDSDEERRVCLSNVLIINPANHKAKDELNSIERRAAMSNIQTVKPGVVGVNRTTLLIGGGVIVGVLVLLSLLVGALGTRASQSDLPTDAAIVVPPSASVPVVPVAVQATNAPGSVASTIPPTAPTPTTASIGTTPTRSTPGVEVALLAQSTLPPTWTPPPSATSLFPATGTPLPTPTGLSGRMVAISGPILTLEGFLPVYVLKPDGTDFKRVTDESNRGEYGILTPDGKLIYTFLAGGTDSRLLRYTNLNGTQPRVISEAWGGLPPLSNQRMASITGDGRILAFAAQNIIQNEQFSAIFVVNMSRFLSFPTPQFVPTVILPTDTEEPVPTANLNPEVPTATTAPVQPTPGKGTVRPKATTPAPPPPTVAPTRPPPTKVPTKAPISTKIPVISPTPQPLSANLIRVTQKDIGENNWPSISRDGRNIVFTTDATSVGKDGVDLYIAPVQPDTTPLQLTTDGSTTFESAPSFSPDGKRIVFNTATEADPAARKNSVVLMNVDGSGREVLAEKAGSNNIRPHFSPDGKFVAFSSDRSGKMEIFVINLATKELFQVTKTENPTILTDWAP